MNLNKAMLIGRLTRDPEMRYTQSGGAVTNFSIATNRYGTGADGERKEYTDFHNIVAWNQGKRNLAEICAQYLHKGSLVYVEGRLSTRSWEGKDGSKQRTTEINANDVQFLESRGASMGGGGGEAAVADDEFAATGGAAAGGGAGAASGASAPSGGAPAGGNGAPAAGSEEIDPDDIPF
ncbi:MAG TPA: single-stranded DNA-binding protein [Candidatus Dormibacteraeota bacterium]|jgi:single-strand DNA-binding protein|nr:single-stranded DNA-binding protein [Candidatus Dormibacteraeota bacterium]